MCRRSYIALFLTLCLVLLWDSGTYAQNFPYHLSVETVMGHCNDDARLVFTLLDDNNNVIQIDPQTHNAVNTAQYPLYNVQYHYQNVSAGLGVQYDYDNDVTLPAGIYNVGVRANILSPGGAFADTTILDVQLTTLYQPLEVSVLTNLAISNIDGHERYGYHPSFHCRDMGRIQLQITQGSFPYKVTILDEQQDTVRHVLFYHRVNSGTFILNADYQDYYTFDSLPIGTYSIYVTDSCGSAAQQMSFTIPDAEPTAYYVLVRSDMSECPDETTVKFSLERRNNTGFGTLWKDYTYPYLDSVVRYRFINPGNDTTEWRYVSSPPLSSAAVCGFRDTLSSYCDFFYDTVRVQLQDLCRDTLMTFLFRFLPEFALSDSTLPVQLWDTITMDTCANHLQSGVFTQAHMLKGSNWNGGSVDIYGSSYYYTPIHCRYYRCPLSYDVWSDTTLLAHSESEDFTGQGAWVTFGVDTSVNVHVAVTDALGCQLAEKDTVFVYDASPLDDVLFWFECHSDKDDDGKDHCCDERYLWIQEHGVDADTFRRNMTLRLMDSPLYDKFNFTAVRQDGVWNITFDDPNNHSSYLEFSYIDGWQVTLRDSVCLAPGRYVFEVTTDCGVDTITYSQAGYYNDTLWFATPPQYEYHQICDHVDVIQTVDIESYIYYIDPSISNDVPIQEECQHMWYSYSPYGINSTAISTTGQRVFSFTLPGSYPIYIYSRNTVYMHGVAAYQCTPDYDWDYDYINISFSYLGFDVAAALLCDSTSGEGVVYVQAVNGNTPYTYTLYSQPGATGNVIASNNTGFFDNVSMTEGQQFSVQVTDSCQASFFVNMTAALLTQGGLLWETGAATDAPHLEGDTAHLTALTMPEPATYSWTGPNGFSSTSQSIDIVLSDTTYSGWYYLQILNSFCGPVITDSIYITVVPPPQVIVFYDTVCQGESYSDNGFTLAGAETSIPSTLTLTRLQQTGYYADTVVLYLTINPSVDTIVEVTASGSYTWHGVTYTASGAYIHHTDGCGMETLLLTITDTLGVTIVVDDDSLCRGEGATLDAQVANAYALPPVAVGDILCTDGDIVKPSSWPVAGKTALGVVFYVDTSGAHGWAVHLNDQSEQVRWSTILVDVPGVSNFDNFHYDGVFPDFAGYANTQAIWAAGNASTYPAAYAVDFPHGWYLPDVGQLDVLFSEMAVLNPSLQITGGTPFPTDTAWFYWSSTEAGSSNPGYAWFVCSNGLVDYWGKTSTHYNYLQGHYADMVEGYLRVRSIRDF